MTREFLLKSLPAATYMYKIDKKLQEYFERLNRKIGETDSADKILEGPWWDIVIKELNHMSYYCVRHLQLKTGKPYCKSFSNGSLAWEVPYEEAPPIRLLSMALVLSYWLGFHAADKGHELHKGTTWFL